MSHYKAWSYKKEKNIKRRKLLRKNLKIKGVLDLDFKLSRSQVRGKHSKGR